MSCSTATVSLSDSMSHRRWWTLLVVVAGQFMFVVDAFVVNIALPSIRADLHAGAGAMQAIVAVYQIAYATLVITGGRLGDIIGRRRCFILGVLGFVAASLWCGLAATGGELVAARLAQGATAALMVPQVLATIHSLFPDEARSRAFAVFGISLGLGGAVGVVLGGWLVTFDPGGLGWRSVFLVNLPVGAMIAVAASVLLPRSELSRSELARADRLPATRLDLPGTGLLFLGLGGLIVPVMAGPGLGWPLWLFAIMAAGAGVLALFLRLERWVKARGGLPLIELDLLADRTFLRGLAALFAFQFGNMAFYLIITLYLQTQLGLAPFRAGAMLVTLALAFTIASRLAGHWVPRHGIRVLIAGATIQLLTLIALAVVADAWAVPDRLVLVSLLTVFGFGQGLVLAPLSGVVLATVRPEHAGSGSGIVNTMHQAAGATGVSLVGMLWFQSGPVAALGLLALASLVTIGLLLDPNGEARGRSAR
jgi:EmrB/QacA subfamily drug resistance transporter